jgi:2-amino-4-hydroxy-6-hydroxymethyldihydropteridine diphosphokinase
MDQGSSRYGIAVGSNAGDPKANLRAGLSRLMALLPEARLTAVAPLYETDPVDCPPGSQVFYNSVVEIECRLTPHALREVTAEVERWAGRPEVRERNAPRTLDLDLLYCGEAAVDDAILTIPHPRLALRRFVLAPLSEIRPDLVLPGQQATIRELLAALPPGEEVVQVADKNWLEIPQDLQ